MLQVFIVEGIVTGKQWTVGRVKRFRLAHYRSPDTDEADYITVVIPPAHPQYDQTFEPGQRVIVKGYFQSHDYEETLKEVARRAGLSEKEIERLPDATVKRVSTEMVAENIYFI